MDATVKQTQMISTDSSANLKIVEMMELFIISHQKTAACSDN